MVFAAPCARQSVERGNAVVFRDLEISTRPAPTNRHPGGGRGPGSVQRMEPSTRQFLASSLRLATPPSSASVACADTILDAGLRRHDGRNEKRPSFRNVAKGIASSPVA